MEKIDTLVFAGGGARGVAYVGALLELANHYDWWSTARRLKRVLGCSIGALFAAMVAVGATADEICDTARENPLRNLINPDIKLLFRTHGMDTGDAVLQWVDELLRAKTGRRNISLLELHEITGVTLELVATNLNLARGEYLSHRTAPTMRVAEAIMVSMSLPPLFSGRNWSAPVGRARCTVAELDSPVTSGQTVRLPDGIAMKSIDGAELPAMTTSAVVEGVEGERVTLRVDRTCTVVDGGLVDNFPMRRALELVREENGEDEAAAAQHCLGFRLVWSNAFALNSITSYYSRAAAVALTAAEMHEIRALPPSCRIIAIDTGPVNCVDLDLSSRTVDALLARGRLAVLDNLEK